MKFNGRIFEDLSRVADGAAEAFGGLRDHLAAGASGFGANRESEAATVTREEFDAVERMVAKGRATQEDILRRIAVLEAQAGIQAPQAAAPGQGSSKDEPEIEGAGI